jgi:hypothetical protein
VGQVADALGTDERMVNSTSPHGDSGQGRNVGPVNGLTLRTPPVTCADRWFRAQTTALAVLGGVSLAPELDPLAAVGTLLVVALLLSTVDRVFLGVRRAVWLALESVPVAVAATVVLNAALFWAAGNLARAAGLGFAVTGAVAALAGSLLVRLVSWAASNALATPAG